LKRNADEALGKNIMATGLIATAIIPPFRRMLGTTICRKRAKAGDDFGTGRD
jgi:hypothetical protein